jgi:hypothetical protein
MSTISAVGKVGYVYDQPTDTWHPVAGYANTTETYTWSGPHTFSNTVNFDSVLNAKAGINNFATQLARDVAITSPINGIVVFVRDSNQIQYYHNGAWRVYGDNANLVEKTSGHVLELIDAGKTIQMNVSSGHTVTIPTNAQVPFQTGTQIAFVQIGLGQTSFTSALGVEILSKNSNKKISARYSPATLIKRDTNTWILIGDLTA